MHNFNSAPLQFQSSSSIPQMPFHFLQSQKLWQLWNEMTCGRITIFHAQSARRIKTLAEDRKSSTSLAISLCPCTWLSHSTLRLIMVSINVLAVLWTDRSFVLELVFGHSQIENNCFVLPVVLTLVKIIICKIRKKGRGKKTEEA